MKNHNNLEDEINKKQKKRYVKDSNEVFLMQIAKMA